MPRVKIYQNERKSFTIRLSEDVYTNVQNRLKLLDGIKLQNYIERLIADDLLVAEFEAKKSLLTSIKGGKINEI